MTGSALWAAQLLRELAEGDYARVSAALDMLRDNPTFSVYPSNPGPTLRRDDPIHEPDRYTLHESVTGVEIAAGGFLINIRVNTGTNQAASIIVFRQKDGSDHNVASLNVEAA